jgi:hypothetical protein
LGQPCPGTWTVAVNNHVDVDGILSVYVLVHSQHALAHRRTIVEAAEMGDFWGWGELPAQRVFQGLTWLMERGSSAQSIYADAFRRIPGLIDGTDPEVASIEDSLTPLHRGVELVESGQIFRKVVESQFVQYIVPLAVAGNDGSRATYAPEFNEAISPNALLWPQVCARWDAQRVCLVSVERTAGWFHDLCSPGYLWADTEGRWLVPGLTYHDGMSSYEISSLQFIAAFHELQRQETARGQWSLGGTKLPFGNELQSRFPVIGRFLDEQGQPAISQLSPDQVATGLRGVFP